MGILCDMSSVIIATSPILRRKKEPKTQAILIWSPIQVPTPPDRASLLWFRSDGSRMARCKLPTAFVTGSPYKRWEHFSNPTWSVVCCLWSHERSLSFCHVCQSPNPSPLTHPLPLLTRLYMEKQIWCILHSANYTHRTNHIPTTYQPYTCTDHIQYQPPLPTAEHMHQPDQLVHYYLQYVMSHHIFLMWLYMVVTNAD